MTIIKFRPYRVRRVAAPTQFVNYATATQNREFADEDLAKSGLTIDDIGGYASGDLILPDGALAGYLIPYFDVNGDVLRGKDNYADMYRVKLKYPPLAKASRYTQPSGQELQGYGLPTFLPYFYPCEDLSAETIYCCEGEKKTASVVRNLELAAFGISGCNLWANPARTGGPHPWMLEYLHRRGTKKVIIIPDGDVFRYDICTAYGTFANALLQAGFEVELLNPPGKIDDLILEWGTEARAKLASVSKLKPDQLVQSPSQLATTYDLAFKRTKDDKIIVHQHTSNIMRLIENHSAFPKIWRNLDTNRVYIGDNEAIPDLTEMEIANHIQHNFGMDKVTHRVVFQCIQAVSKKNQRSPMLDHIKTLHWDGIPRLDTWLHTSWGVEDNEFNREVSSKWLLSACARMADPGSKVDWMLIVVGPQGTGKTSMPAILFRDNSLTLYGESNDKDLRMLLHSALVVGFDELDSFTRRETSWLKAMITTTEDMFRPPYGASVEVFKRRFTLYGCGNKHEFLQSDPSGQRRYPIIEVKRLLDFKWLEEHRDQLWAEAWQRYERGGDKWWEVEGATENAKKFEIPNLLHERIDNAISKLSIQPKQAANKGPLEFNMTELFLAMDESNKPTGNTAIVRDAAAYLKSIGYERKIVYRNGQTKQVYVKTQ